MGQACIGQQVIVDCCALGASMNSGDMYRELTRSSRSTLIGG